MAKPRFAGAFVLDRRSHQSPITKISEVVHGKAALDEGRVRPPAYVTIQSWSLMKTCLIAFSIFAALTGTVHADAIAARQAAMKRISQQLRVLSPFAKGDLDYDAAAVMSALQTLDAEVKAYDVEVLFPAGSETGNTKVSQKIWTDRPGFQAAVDKFSGDVASAVAANPHDVAALTPLVAAIGSNCGSCHGAWRN